MPTDLIAELERLAAEATPGPWSVGKTTQRGQEVWIDTDQPTEALRYSHWAGMVVCYGCDDQPEAGAVVAAANAALIVAAINALPRLLAVWRAAEAVSAADALVRRPWDGCGRDPALDWNEALAALRSALSPMEQTDARATSPTQSKQSKT